MSVHPRARGERHVVSRLLGHRRGSSPRTRGTEGGGNDPTDYHRFIPAHAGNGVLLCVLWCGVFGSSPRTRGTGNHVPQRWRAPRFIPAHAGNGDLHRLCIVFLTVHPRARGERFRLKAGRAASTGSSPRTRGTGLVADGAAGLSPVHPRARGERRTPPKVRHLDGGSSPRTRGTEGVGRCAKHAPRFIPAHAGNGHCLARVISDVAVHPRARGERLAQQAATASATGSSPRTRGTGSPLRKKRCIFRFIPAHAGNGTDGTARLAGGTVHPRARGERASLSHLTAPCFGSSPRTRGTDPSHLEKSLKRRFIPAHAGNGCSWARRP